jgi:hypothetical protein
MLLMARSWNGCRRNHIFDDACVSLHQDIHLSSNAAVIASDILCFGRTAAGETYTSGNIWQHSRIYRDGKLIWFEQGCLEGDGESMQSPLGLAGRSVSGMVLAAGAMLSSAQLLQLREESRALLDAREPQALCGVTQMKSVLVARYLGNSARSHAHGCNWSGNTCAPSSPDNPHAYRASGIPEWLIFAACGVCVLTKRCEDTWYSQQCR